MTALGDGDVETAAAMASAMRAGDVSSAELVERSLRRAETWQSSTHAFSQIWAEEALEEAGRADAVPPDARQPLNGVPIAIKDLFDVAGHETTGCCAAYAGNVARRDSAVVRAIRRTGVVLLGKTNMHELAAGGTNLVSACGRTGNPWNPEHMTGGSSGGSGAAVTAGVVPMALGSDTGGSIRIPASMCGCFGLKPTTGMYPLNGVLPLAPSLDCPGPMAETVEDLELLLGAMGIDTGPPPASDDPPGPPRIGMPDGFFLDRVHTETLATVRATAEALAMAGAAVEPVDGHGLEDARRVWMRVCTPEFAAAHRAVDRTRIHPSVVEWMELGESLSDEERADARSRRREIRRWFLLRLEEREALLIPTTPYPAPRADQKTVDLGQAGTVDVEHVGPGWMTCSVNLAGLPAINLPAGRSAQGLPIGVSLVGKENGERTLLRLALLWQEAVSFRSQRPEIRR